MGYVELVAGLMGADWLTEDDLLRFFASKTWCEVRGTKFVGKLKLAGVESFMSRHGAAFKTCECARCRRREDRCPQCGRKGGR